MSPASSRATVASVSVLLLTHVGGPEIDAILDTLVPDADRLDQVVVTGLSSESAEIQRAAQHPVFDHDVRLALVPEAGNSVAGAINKAQEKFPREADHWVWVLHDDSLPAPGALHALVERARRSSRVGVVGPKLVRDTDTRVLIGVGHHLTRSGRAVEADAPDMVDQGQWDSRADVIGVPVPGMLIKSDVLADIGGVDPAFAFGTEGVDISWRSHLRGHRVVVAPEAVVAQGEVGLGMEHPRWHRRHLRQIALARNAWWRSMWFTLRIIVSGLLATLGFLVVRRGGAAAGEFADVRAAFSPVTRWGARWRFRGSRLVRDRDLQGLFASTGAGWRAALDTAQEAILPEPEMDAEQNVGRGPVESGPVAEDSVALDDHLVVKRSWWSWPLTCALVLATVGSALSWRGLLGALTGTGVVGAELAAVTGGFEQGWQAWSTGWSGAGLGSSGSEALWLLPMGALAWVISALPLGVPDAASLGVATAWLLLLAAPLSVITAYRAARITTARRSVKAMVGLGWASLSPLTVAIGTGRVGPVVVHILAPVMIAGVVLALSRSSGPRGSAASFGAAAAIAIASWFVPAVLLFAAASALAVLIGARGYAKLRALILIGIPLVLAGPRILTWWQDPQLLAGGAGATSVQRAPAEWEMALMHPGGPASFIMWWTIPVWLLALVATILTGRGQRRSLVLMGGAALGLLVALLMARLGIAVVPEGFSDAGAVVFAWPGTILSLVGACVALAAAAGAEALADSRRGSGATGQALLSWSSAGTVLLGVGAVAIGVLFMWRSAVTPGDLERAQPTVSPIVAEQIQSPDAPRYLQLTPIGPQDSFVVTYALQGSEVGPWVRDRVDEAVNPIAAQDELLQGQVSLLVDGESDVVSTDSAAGGVLLDLAVGFLSVRADEEHPLVRQLDQIEGLTRITSPAGEVVWRVVASEATPGAARVRVFDEAGAEVAALPVSGGHAQVGAISVPADAHNLVISEAVGWGAVAEVVADGEVLAPMANQVPLTYDLPESTSEISVSLPVENRWWWLMAAMVGTLALFFSLPLGAARNGRRA